MKGPAPTVKKRLGECCVSHRGRYDGDVNEMEGLMMKGVMSAQNAATAWPMKIDGG